MPGAQRCAVGADEQFVTFLTVLGEVSVQSKGDVAGGGDCSAREVKAGCLLYVANEVIDGVIETTDACTDDDA